MKKYFIMINCTQEFDFDTKKELEKYVKFQKKKRWEIVRLVELNALGVVNRKQHKQWKILGFLGHNGVPKDWFRTYNELTNTFVGKNE